MKFILLFSLALLELLLCHKGSALFLDDDCHLTHDDDVPRTAPWMASVSTEQGFICGGTLITKNFVLTAAHCIENRKSLFVELGSLDRNDANRESSGVKRYNVTRVIVHPGYKSLPGPHDIGLLNLASQVDYGYQIEPICILMENAASVLQNINTFSAFGWGATESEHASEHLMMIKLRRRRSEACQDNGLPKLTNSQICADSETGGGPCYGDGGGPLAATFMHHTVQVGIISYGPIDCNSSAVYTDVASYTDWIVSVVHRA